jgi:riboflavin synthase
MFTGLIESIGTVAEVAHTPDGIRLRVDSDLASALSAGDSLAVNGVCLTVLKEVTAGSGIQADLSPETARISTLGRLKPGSLVNLERAVRADTRIGGHFVQGHVDDMGALEDIREEGNCYRITVSVPLGLTRYIVQKGSIAVDGISLTVASVDDARFDVQIIPFTWLHTNLKAARVGDQVNVECDILGKYAARAFEVVKGKKRKTKG